MYMGRYQLGEHVPLRVLTNTNRAAVVPDYPPVAKVFDSSGSVRFNKRIPVSDRYGQTGLFSFRLFLDSTFATGHYSVTFTWIQGTDVGCSVGEFDIVAGGDADGAIIALHRYQTANAQFIMREMDSGELRAGRNPSL